MTDDVVKVREDGESEGGEDNNPVDQVNWLPKSMEFKKESSENLL